MTQVVALTASDVTQINQIIQHMQGQAGSTDAYIFRTSAGNNLTIILSDNAGARKFSIKDSDEAEVFSVDSDGAITNSGAFSPGSLIVPLSATPSQTTEGSAAWDTDDDRTHSRYRHCNEGHRPLARRGFECFCHAGVDV
jgi:hypothetical protein